MASVVLCAATDVAVGGRSYHALKQPRSTGSILRNGLCATSHTYIWDTQLHTTTQTVVQIVTLCLNV